MREIIIERNHEPRILTGDLLLFGAMDAAEQVRTVDKPTSRIGRVIIDGIEMNLLVTLVPIECKCPVGLKKKNFNECEFCGGKWSTRKKEAR